MTFDFHTHNLQAPAGHAIINLPREWIEQPALFAPRPHALYSAGIHPWWTADAASTAHMLENLPALLAHPQVVALGECGLDALQGGPPEFQESVFCKQIAWAEAEKLPVTLHVVRCFDRLLRLHKALRPTTRWTVHGFRGKPALARQLLKAGMDLSFGTHHHPEAFALTPPDRRKQESDEEP